MNGHGWSDGLSLTVIHGESATSTLMPNYDDPAFSSDPHVHPFFATHSTWSLKPDDHPSLLASPMFSDDNSSTTHESSSSSNHTSTTPPTSTDSHLSHKPSHLRWPPDVQKKKKSISMFWRRSPPDTVLASVDLSRNVSSDPVPARSMTPTSQMASNPHTAEPELPASVERPNKPQRSSATSPSDFKPPPLSASRLIAGGLAMRGNELDRIDELDESNPIGLSLHHDGPYEAVHKTTVPEQSDNVVLHNIGSQYQIPMPRPIPEKQQHLKRNKRHKLNFSDGSIVPIVPAGVSLNLSPGQILPHDFYIELNHGMIPANPSGWPPQQPRQPHIPSQSQPNAEHLVTQPPLHLIQGRQQTTEKYSYHHNNNHPRAYAPSRSRNAPPEYTALPTDHYSSNGDSKNFQPFVPPLLNFEDEKKFRHDLPGDKKSIDLNVKYLPPMPTITIHPESRGQTHGTRPSNPRLPPRMQALQMQIPRYDEKQRRPPKLPSGTQEHAPYLSGRTVIQSGHSVNPPPMVDIVHQVPLFVDNRGFPVSAPAPPALDILQAVHEPVKLYSQSMPDKNNTPSAHSIHSGSDLGNSRSGPPPHHLPKRLVMPTPLQSSQPIAPRHQPQPNQPPRHVGNHSWQPQLRPPSPPIVPTALDPYTEIQLRAEDLEMTQGRKLRKRSVQGVPQPTLPPIQPLVPQTTLLYDDLPVHQPLSIRKPEKSQKRVLSKRRFDL